MNEIIERFSNVKQNQGEQVISFYPDDVSLEVIEDDYLISIEKKENVSQMFDNND